MFIANEIDQLFRSVRSDMSDMALLAERAMFVGCKSYKHSAPPEHNRLAHRLHSAQELS